MPLPLAAIIGAGSNLAGGLINSLSTADQNRKSREFSEKMYDKQKADNYSFWSTQNDYNSPQAQMARYQAAGLNPNLIYGAGNSGNAGAISAPDVQTPQYRSPEWGNGLQTAGLAYMNAIYDLEIKQAQIDNLKASNTVIQQDALLKAAQIPNTQTRTERERFNLDFESELRPISADARREQLRQLKTSTDLSLNRDAREAALNASSVQEAAERILSMREQRTTIPYQKRQMSAATSESLERVRQMLKDGTIKDLDIELRKQGINPNDPMWSRIVGRFLSNILDGSSSGSWWQKLFFGNN